MSVALQKRQKEMKRLKKQLAKAEKRAQKKEARRAAKEADTTASVNPNTSTEPVAARIVVLLRCNAKSLLQG